MRTGFPMKCPVISRLSLRRGLRAPREATHNDDAKVIFRGAAALIKFLTLRHT